MHQRSGLRDCNGNHETKEHTEATRKEANEEQADGEVDSKCSNCGEEGHKAFHKQCAVFRKVQATVYKQW